QLNSELAVTMATWYARFYAALGIPCASIETLATSSTSAPYDTGELIHPIIECRPWALVLYAQFHSLCALWHSPMAPIRAVVNESAMMKLVSDSECTLRNSPTPPFVAAWMSGPAFVKSLDHSRMSFEALDRFMAVYGGDKLYESGTMGYGFTIAMSAVSLLVAVKELQRLATAPSYRADNVAQDALTDPLGAAFIHGFTLQAQSHINTAIKATQALGNTWEKGK
ncbi:hypothetical protein HDU93_003513, partial [Gonapodya sp. JEL0774]